MDYSEKQPLSKIRAMKELVLSTSNLAIGYRQKGRGDRVLQQELNLELNQGEITCLLGTNGSGKSTLIRTLAGFQKAMSGDVRFGNRKISEYSPAHFAKKISVVLTEQVFVGNMNVFDMVAYGRAPYTGFLGRLEAKDIRAIENALSQSGIEKLHDRKFLELSDGERQKVMIAKSLAQETPVIFLDEPTAFLDFPSKVEILLLLRNASWQQNKAILLSTHDLNLAIRFADKIWLMGNGKSMQSGIPEDLIMSGQFAGFFDREKTRFNIRSGNFEFEAETIGNINISGNGVAFDWLKNALLRKGYQVNGKEKPMAKIEVLSNNYNFQTESTTRLLGSIAEVLNALKKT